MMERGGDPMGKDPAFLFYSSDFLTGVSDLTMQERGQYITLLCLQHQKGHLNEKTICLNLGLCSVSEIPDVMKKYHQDENGLYFQDVLDGIIQKRQEYADSRRLNGLKGGRPRKEEKHTKSIEKTMEKPYGLRMPNHSENENINESKDKRESEEREEKIPYKIIIDYLNLKAGTAFRNSSQKTKDVIKARFNDGFAIEDFYKVIDIKTDEWSETGMSIYLRPETLFSNKFEGYLNQKPVARKKQNFAGVIYTDEQLSKFEDDPAELVRKMKGEKE